MHANINTTWWMCGQADDGCRPRWMMRGHRWPAGSHFESATRRRRSLFGSIKHTFGDGVNLIRTHSCGSVIGTNWSRLVAQLPSAVRLRNGEAIKPEPNTIPPRPLCTLWYRTREFLNNEQRQVVLASNRNDTAPVPSQR